MNAKRRSVDRVKFIIDSVTGRSVLHLGCADWPYTLKKIEDGALLHDVINLHAANVTGFDISTPGVNAMLEAGYSDIVLGNAEESLYAQLGKTFDVVLAGEIIEHVLNPGLFLESIKSVMGDDSRLVITTPNYAAIKKVARAPLREIVHPEHVCYFSPNTLAVLLESVGLNIEDVQYYWVAPRKASRVANWLLNVFPLFRPWADGICVTATRAD
ncbi:class I SAM-dependent methyltransferase [Algiphilus aromaticivorans]|uniref:class I SAM-dependent methyltransferase n=1 Tax=Algiphilus aromaticivorans TaxID=382454 RepID=UPI0009FFF361|nr:class I SAM-dependent methyltransferase [Algiphilus aromaticivorans]